jgi:hypothetical protein
MRGVFFSPDASRIISQSAYESMSWDGEMGRRLHASEHNDHRLSGSMYVTHEGWIVHSTTDRTLGKLPGLAINSKFAVHERSLAVGTYSGDIFILHFPLALLASPETRASDMNMRERFGPLS